MGFRFDWKPYFSYVLVNMHSVTFINIYSSRKTGLDIRRMKKFLFISFFILNHIYTQIVQVGSGSYTTSFPGVDEAGRNGYPSGEPQTTGPAANKHIPTNDWWSSVIKNDHANNLFNYPLALKTTSQGLVVSYIPWGVYDDQEPIVVGLSGLSTPKAKVYDFTDWTVTIDWTDANNSIKATSGIGMPFIYFEKDSLSIVKIDINLGQASLIDEMIIIEDARNGADFVIYAPSGSSWQQSANSYTSNLNGSNYWSLAMLPQGSTSLISIAEDLKKYAYVFPQNTYVDWDYDEDNGLVYTNYTVDVDIKEGQYSNILQGLLPHQWNNLSDESSYPDEYIYNSVRGELRMLNSNSFSTINIFSGILPTLPSLGQYSIGYDPALLQDKISQIENNQLATWTDSYNEGQVMNRLVQTGRIAHEIGDTDARDQILTTIKERLEDWLTASSSEVAFLFYYNDTWSTLIGYPAGHGQDYNINDHHFHWGYFIHAASFVEQFTQGWANQWGEMVNHLVRDAASLNRNDPEYPFLRSFSPYAGHCWANGFATFPQGNDQESTSESMQFNSSLIHWGSVTGDNEIRDLGIYLYTTERTAIDEYWFDMYERNFSEDHPYSLVSRVWGNSYDNGTFWTNDIAASYGIEMYPIHGGSFYLSHNLDYTESLWNEITMNTGILNNEENPNLWHDVFWKYLAFFDAQVAIQLYDSYPDRSLKFGISDAQTYYWLHNMNSIGHYRSDITADLPIAASFDNNGQITYVAHNYSNQSKTVTFSDGYQLFVEPHELKTNRGSSITGTISSDFNQAYMNGNIQIHLESSIQNISRVEFYDGTSLLGESTSFPFTFLAENLSLGTHNIYARIYSGSEFGLSNIITIVVGEQTPYQNNMNHIPGMIEVGDYDQFEGGIGQNITYFDNSLNNEGDYRLDEYVDVEYFSDIEGPTLGWLEAGEWVEYSVLVDTAGYYNIEYRYASDISSGGGPFHFEIDGQRISNDMYANNTGDWYNWESGNSQDIELNYGEHILRAVFTEGGFNLGRLTFNYNRPFEYDIPLSNAGEDILVILPSNFTVLDGTQSTNEENATYEINYLWSQVYGPSLISFGDQTSSQTEINELIEGVYKFKLSVYDINHSSNDYVFVFVSSTGDFPPDVSLNTTNLNSTYYYGSQIEIQASANDIDGNVVLVEFYDFDTKIGEDDFEPYSFLWTGISLGSHSVIAVAIDNDGLVSSSNPFSIEILEAPSCTGGPDNGDYTYEFSDNLNNPTITFIPSASHVGNPTCILYYSTSGTPPGYPVTPNVPFQINANEGETIQFYYTYSYNGLERNTSANPHSYEIGSCYNESLSSSLDILPGDFMIHQNYPNPFNPITSLRYDLPENGLVNITIYDMMGRIVKNLVSSQQNAGYKSISWNATNDRNEPVSAGLYLYTMQSGEFRQTKKMVLLK